MSAYYGIPWWLWLMGLVVLLFSSMIAFVIWDETGARRELRARRFAESIRMPRG